MFSLATRHFARRLGAPRLTDKTFEVPQAKKIQFYYERVKKATDEEFHSKIHEYEVYL